MTFISKLTATNMYIQPLKLPQKQKKSQKKSSERFEVSVIMAVPRIKLGSQGFEVSAQGLGCMGMSAFCAPTNPKSEMISLIHHAVSKDINFLDTSDVYGPHTNVLLLAKALKRIRDNQVWKINAGSLKRLTVDCIDLYYQHRVETRVPIEVTIAEMKKLVEEGKIKYIGLSEASASTIRRAHVVHPIATVQT
ncbi:hypothetical protein SUGI_0018980 [Cryptomeria japonica]|nr:hypothetical protein SUGI_0018980 [Cryptomeria japonica]